MSEFEDKLQSILGNPEALSQIMSIAQSITGSSASEESNYDNSVPSPPDTSTSNSPLSMLENLDPRLLQVGMQLLSEYNSSDDRKTALLTALQPFVKESRYTKVDKAIQIAKLARVIRVALDVFRKGDDDRV